LHQLARETPVAPLFADEAINNKGQVELLQETEAQELLTRERTHFVDPNTKTNMELADEAIHDG
jgi:hypothetical protein